MPTPELLGPESLDALLGYASLEPEMNIFITGDVEQFGLAEPVNAYAMVNGDGSWDSVVVRFYGNYVVYSPNPLYDAAAVADFVRAASGGQRVLGSINGKLEVVGPLSNYFEESSLHTQYLARCTSIIEGSVAPLDPGIELRRVTEHEYGELFALLGGMRAYRGLYDDPASVAMATQQRIANEARGCLTYGAFLDGEMVGTASTGTATRDGAVIVGLGTRSDMRLEGIASALVARLVEECLADGKRFVCGFYRSRETGRLCERLGFEPIGSYAMLY